jgi:hypothetical protein
VHLQGYIAMMQSRSSDQRQASSTAGWPVLNKGDWEAPEDPVHQFSSCMQIVKSFIRDTSAEAVAIKVCANLPPQGFAYCWVHSWAVLMAIAWFSFHA